MYVYCIDTFGLDHAGADETKFHGGATLVTLAQGYRNAQREIEQARLHITAEEHNLESSKSRLQMHTMIAEELKLAFKILSDPMGWKERD